MAFERDEMSIRIADVLMKVRRCSSQPEPHEITVVIPHVEIRRRFFVDGQLAEEELILDSITIVDSPRHLPENGRPQLPGPRTTWRYIPAPKDDATRCDS